MASQSFLAGYAGVFLHIVVLCLSCSVCQVPVAEGKSVQQTVDILHKKLEQLGAVKQQGSFCVDCETYHATGNVSGNIFIFLSLRCNLIVVVDCPRTLEHTQSSYYSSIILITLSNALHKVQAAEA